jgi:hypothetical protein
MIKNCNSREAVCDRIVVTAPYRSQWLRGLRNGSAVARLPGLQVCFSVVVKPR